MLKIDVFNHILPQNYFDLLEKVAGDYGDMGNRMRSIPILLDLDERFRVMDRFGDYEQILSIAGPAPEMMAGPEGSPELCEVANDGMAELCQKYPDRFPGFCSLLPMNNPDAIIEEIHRSIKDLGSNGAHIYTNADGKPLDLPEFDPIWEVMADYDLPIWVHPTRNPDIPDYLSEPHSKFEIWWTFGWPYETAAFMARMVFKGIFDKYPNLKMITHHGGGMVPFTEGRVVNGWQSLGQRTTREDYTGVLGSLDRPHEEYFKMFYA
ncbi:MAG: amidohydrolase family protein, partial [Rhodospirillales bacterium]|nr:amidohydrolase family protein [Rhodospirillales bacterium]